MLGLCYNAKIAETFISVEFVKRKLPGCKFDGCYHIITAWCRISTEAGNLEAKEAKETQREQAVNTRFLNLLVKSRSMEQPSAPVSVEVFQAIFASTRSRARMLHLLEIKPEKSQGCYVAVQCIYVLSPHGAAAGPHCVASGEDQHAAGQNLFLISPCSLLPRMQVLRHFHRAKKVDTCPDTGYDWRRDSSHLGVF
ncbi:hypothetical protein BST61_g9580 [Cercospora zeina]